jgi:transcription initiation factor TFIIH subunit 4
VLNLFVSLKYRFPNLVVGSITRESVKKALDNGISAEQVRLQWFLVVFASITVDTGQIISYLTTHAHPQMRKNVCLIIVLHVPRR